MYEMLIYTVVGFLVGLISNSFLIRKYRRLLKSTTKIMKMYESVLKGISEEQEILNKYNDKEFICILKETIKELEK